MFQSCWFLVFLIFECLFSFASNEIVLYEPIIFCSLLLCDPCFSAHLTPLVLHIEFLFDCIRIK